MEAEDEVQSTTSSNNKPTSLSHSIRDILGLANAHQESVNDEEDEQKSTDESQQQNIQDNNNKNWNPGKWDYFLFWTTSCFVVAQNAAQANYYAIHAVTYLLTILPLLSYT